MKHREAPSLAAADEAVVVTLPQTVWSVAGHPHSAGSDLERVTCQSRIMKLSLLALLLLAPLAALYAADNAIVQEGRASAEIVIAEKPARMTRLAAKELQTYVAKISAAKLPIVTQPSDEQLVKLFVGRSEHTDRRKIDASGLKYGAYRIVSGDDWLAFIGDDTDFTQYAKGGEVWDKKRPKSLGAPKPMSPAKKAKAKAMAKALRAAKVSHEYVVVDGAPHTFDLHPKGKGWKRDRIDYDTTGVPGMGKDASDNPDVTAPTLQFLRGVIGK